MADSLQHLELDVVMHRRGVASGVDVHEAIVLAEEEQRRPFGRSDGEVIVQAAAEIEEHRARRFGVCQRRLGILVPLGSQRDQTQAKIGIEARGIVQAPLEARVDESFGAEQSCPSADELTADRRPHHGREARQPHQVAHPRTQMRQRRVDHHEVGDEVGTACGHPDADRRTHRVADDHRRPELFEHGGDQASVGGDRGRSAGCTRTPEPDEVDRRDGRAEPVGEWLANRLPRQRVGAKAVHEQDACAVQLAVGGGCPAVRVDAYAVGVDRQAATDRRARVALPRVVPRHEANLSAVTLSTSDDRPHPPDDDPTWSETWGFDLASDEITGFVRFTRLPSRGLCWCWVVVRSPELGIVVVRDDDVQLPRREDSLEVRGDGLWLELVCETPFEHWGIGLEAFGLRVESTADEVGERLPVGLDLEWETDGSAPIERGTSSYEQSGVIHGDLVVADERIACEGTGTRDHAWGSETLPEWPT